LSAPLLEAEMARQGIHAEAVLAQSRRLERAGYPVTVAVTPDASNLHYEDAEGRERLLRAGGGWQLRRTRRPFSQEELLARFAADPACLSPNVLLRPVVESAVFPTLAYVGGPAETSYFAQIGCLFRACGLMPPIVLPRAGFTLVEPKVRRRLARLGLEPSAALAPVAELKARLIAAALPAGLKDAVALLREAVGEGWSRVALEARTVDPTLDGPLRALLQNSLDQVSAAERRIETQLGEKNARAVATLERAAGSLAPGGVPQERILNVASFVARYGPDVLHALYEAIEIPVGDGAIGWDGPECEE
jgi:bacillithiol synthase